MTEQPPSSAPTNPPPGWYPDPTTGVGFRWWDGSTWSEHTSISPGPPGSSAESGSGLRPVGEWMSEMVQITTKRAGHFFPMIVLVLVPLGLFNSVSLWNAFHNAVMITDQQTGAVSFTNEGVGSGAYVLAGLSVTCVILGATYLLLVAARQAQAVLTDEGEPWSASLSGAFARVPRGFGVAAAIVGALAGLYIALIVIVAIAPLLAIVALPAYVFLSFLIATRLSVAFTAAANGPRDVGSLRTSWQLTKGRFWAVFGRLWLMTLVGMAVSLVASLVAAPFTALAGGGGGAGSIEFGAEELDLNVLFGDNPAVFAVGQLFNAIGWGVATVVWAVGLTTLYRDLGGSTEGQE